MKQVILTDTLRNHIHAEGQLDEHVLEGTQLVERNGHLYELEGTNFKGAVLFKEVGKLPYKITEF